MTLLDTTIVEYCFPKSGPRNRPSNPTTLEDGLILIEELDFKPPPGKVGIWNIKTCQCRWMDDQGFFCAEPTGSPTKSYCPTHHARCFIPAPKKVNRYYAPVRSINP